MQSRNRLQNDDVACAYQKMLALKINRFVTVSNTKEIKLNHQNETFSRSTLSML